MVRIELVSAGVRELLRSQRVRAELERKARRIQAAAGPGHEVESEIGPNRARAQVRTATFDARHREATQRTLTRAIDAGRG